MASTEGQKKSAMKYAKTHCIRVNLSFNKRTDEDVLKKLDSVPNKQGYIKELIRQDIYNTEGLLC